MTDADPNGPKDEVRTDPAPESPPEETDDEDLVFLDDADPEDGPADGAADGRTAEEPPGSRWTMLIVDDEPEIHSITKLVLSDFVYKGRKARFLSAHSAAEARRILAREPDIALILLDVVMETEDAGLRLVHHIREELQNRNVRIILRTGQPGQAPERAVILDYDINDYKAKTQLTAQQLFTTTVAALRSYEDIVTIDANRRGLEKIIEASSSLFRVRSMKLFAAGVLTQLSGLLGVGPDAILCVQRGGTGGPFGSPADGLVDGSAGGSGRCNGEGSCNGLYVLAGSGRFEPLINEPVAGHVDPAVLAAMTACLERRAHVYAGDHCTLYIHPPNDRETVVYLRSNRPLSDLDRKLIEVFCGKISVGFDNLRHYEQLYRAQQGTLAALADLAERGCGTLIDASPPAAAPMERERFSRSLRIAAITERIARRLHADGLFPEALDVSTLEVIGLAAILHDIGNAAVDPVMLSKPGPLDPAERSVMQTHTVAGADLLNQASHLADGLTHLHLGATVARWHHENWDGTGYPDGRAGAAIPLCARIVAVADAYDAMTRDRPYRPALDSGKAVDEIRRLAGQRFDPTVVEAFLSILPDIEQPVESDGGGMAI